MRFRLLSSTEEPFEFRLPDPRETEALTGRTESLHETEEGAKAFAAKQFRRPPNGMIGQPVAMVLAGDRLLWIGVLEDGDLEWRRPVSG